MNKGFFESSKSPFSSSVVCVGKRSVGLGLCDDEGSFDLFFTITGLNCRQHRSVLSSTKALDQSACENFTSYGKIENRTRDPKFDDIRV